MTDHTKDASARRTVLRAGLIILASGAAGAGFAETASARGVAGGLPAGKLTQAKLAQAIVQYQPTPKDGNECDACVNFVAPNACNIVEGDINPKGWCVAFAPKSS